MTSKTPKVKPPKHLSSESKKLFQWVIDSFFLEPHHIRLLALMCEADDRATQARKDVEKNGLTFTDRYGQIKMNPSVQIERDSKVIFARLLRELSLSETPDESRPPALKYGG